MSECQNCGGKIKKTDWGWTHYDPIDGNDPRICFYEPTYATPVLA